MSNNLSDTVNRKFIDSADVSEWEIENEDGWVDITKINKTIEYDVWQLTTTSSFIECADTHIVFRDNHEEVFVKDLTPGDKIIGENGIEFVILVNKTDRKENMFDLSVTGNKTYYAAGLLHHNTTVSAAYFVWYVLFNNVKSVAVMANKQATAFEIMDRIRLAYENLPTWLQQGVKVWNRGSIELENGSKIFGAATTASGTRGRTVNILYLDEYAFVENNLAEAFFTAVYPTISVDKNSKIMITSTPNGFNHFHKFWVEAEKTSRGEPGGNGFYPLRIYWHETPGRDQKWYEDQVLALGELKAAQEIDAEFMGSSRQLLSAKAMNNFTFETPIKEFTDNYKGLRIYRAPIKGHSYVTTVDTSRGRHLDDSAFIVFDITDYPHTIAAVFNNNEISPLMYSGVVHQISKNYNEAYILVETNDVGSQVAEDIWFSFEYENMFWTKGNLLGKVGNPYPGLRTTTKTKRIGCANTKDIIEKNQLLINDQQIISQFSTFVQSSNSSYAADKGFKDDLVMCVVMFGWLCSQPWFIELSDKNVKNQMYSSVIEQMKDDLVLGGMIDGTEDFMEDSPESRGAVYQW